MWSAAPRGFGCGFKALLLNSVDIFYIFPEYAQYETMAYGLIDFVS